MNGIMINGIFYESLPCKEEDFLCNCCDFEGKCDDLCSSMCPACVIAGKLENRMFVVSNKIKHS